VAVAVVAAVVAWLRRPAATRGQLYAEDGRTFVGDWFTHGSIALLREPYAGYQHLLPRLISGAVVWLVPVGGWAVAVNLIVCAGLGAAAGLIYLVSRDVVEFRPSRLVLALIVVIVPIAGQEVMGNLANLHWFLLYLMVWVLLAVPRSPATAWGLAVVAVACAATEPQTAVFLPLALWALIRDRRVWPVTLGWTLGVVAQVVTTIVSPRAVATEWPPVASTVQGYVLNAGMTLGSWRPGWLGRVLTGAGWWPGFLGVALILALAVAGVVLGAPPARVAILALIYGSVVSWTASFVLGGNPAFFYSEYTADQLALPLLVRWGAAASMMLAATIPVAVGVLVQRFPSAGTPAGIGLGAVMTVMVLGGVAGQAQAPPLDRDWGSTVAEARAACAADPGGRVELTTPPGPDWAVPVPCRLISG
jgi:hypothetical protein